MKTILSLVLLFTVSLSSFADDTVKRDTVNELIEVMQVNKMLDSMYSQMDKIFLQIAKDLELRESERPIFEKHMKQISQLMTAELTWEKMQEPVTDIYVKHYSQKELDDLLTFYKSDTGQKLIEKMPLVVQESMMLSQNMLKNIMPKVINISKQMRSEIKLSRND